MAVYDMLNPKQREAVLCTEGPLLLLAGAGSGKTRALTHRIAYLIEELGVNPWNILAITFTNKAAGEMRDRVDSLVASGASQVWVSTFHSACVRILRRYIHLIDYDNNFTIYDMDDQRTLMKQIVKKMQLDPKQYRERALLSIISSAKNELLSPQDFSKQAEGIRHKKIAEAYQEYQSELKKNNALDFDDLIFKTVDLFNEHPDVLMSYQERFHYIMVDEYQDTNYAQFRLVFLLTGRYKNLCVVGDDDQSIYKFRGADIQNILGFEKAFPGARTIKLEQNYRSTSRILDVANAVIRHNTGRKDKTLWTANKKGEPVTFCQYKQAYEEADGIVQEILENARKNGRKYQDFAVLYRTNAQSRLFEEKCIEHNLPYRLVGGVNFYQRKEIKDILSYLKTVANGLDDLAAERIINVPKRGIGAATVGKIMAWASLSETSFYEACRRAEQIPEIGRTSGRVQKFVHEIEKLRGRLLKGAKIKDLIEAVLDDIGYRNELEAEGAEECEARMENIGELVNKAVSYENSALEPSLDGFLEEVALVADVDRMDDRKDCVTLMTLHSAKGLEFPVVYLTGMEDGLFPSSRATGSDDPSDVEEERRLCYVGITRAKERLTMTAAKLRMVNGSTHYSRPSRFIEEIPGKLIEIKEHLPEWMRQNYEEEKGEDEGKGFFMQSSRNPLGSVMGRNPGGKSPGFGRQFSVKKAASLDYSEGDRVRHSTFGDGTVQKIVDGSRDYEVTVDFDKIGQRRMFASFAKLERL